MPNESDSAGHRLPAGDAPAAFSQTGVGLVQGASTGVAAAEAPLARGHGKYPRRHLDLTTGSIPKKLWSLAWPQMVESVLNIVDQMVDLVWAGRLPGGFRAIAGLGVAQSFTQFGMMARQGLDQAMRAMISRAVGSGNIPLANHIALQAFTVTAVYSVIMVIVGLLLTDVLLRVVGTSQEVHTEAALYMRLQFVGMATMSFRMMSGAALQSSADPITPLKATTLTRLLHITLTPFLIFGWWWFPHLGLGGAALANVLAQLAGCVWNFYALFHERSRLHLTLRGYRIDRPLIWRMLKIATPASIAGTERATAQLVLLGLAARFGDVALASYALTRRMEMFAHFGSMGIGQGAGIMAGQNIGAGYPDRARKSVAWALGYIALIQAFIVTILIVFPAFFVMLFTHDAGVVELASTWLQIQAVAAVFMSLSMVFQQSFNIAGDTFAPMIIVLIAVWGIEVPVAWGLSHGMGLGPLGIGYAAIAGMGARLTFYIPYYFWGRWLKVKVI